MQKWPQNHQEKPGKNWIKWILHKWRKKQLLQRSTYNTRDAYDTWEHQRYMDQKRNLKSTESTMTQKNTWNTYSTYNIWCTYSKWRTLKTERTIFYAIIYMSLYFEVDACFIYYTSNNNKKYALWSIKDTCNTRHITFKLVFKFNCQKTQWHRHAHITHWSFFLTL